VVLVNHYSASASEIVSACLQDHGRATIIGERTWGKGTVQRIIQLQGGKSAIRLTTASYWRPSNHKIHRKKDSPESEEWGVSPDAGYAVKLTDDELEIVFRARAQRDGYRPYAEDKKTPEKTAEPPADKPAPEDTSPDAATPPSNDDAPFDDPQLRKAIDFLQRELGPAPPAAA
jgi:carboxyl-terminal processing protease